MKKTWLVLVLAAVGVVCAFLIVKTTGGASDDAASTRLLSRGASGAVREKSDPVAAVRAAMGNVAADAASAKKSRRPRLKAPTDLFANLSGADRRMAEAVQSALDNDDSDAILDSAAKALSSTNVEVRAHAVDALGWLGMEALPELTGAMADPDEDVAEAAESAWELALSDVPGAERRFNIAVAALGTLAVEDHLESIEGHVVGAALELIDGEEDEKKAGELRISVVQALVDIIDAEKTSMPNVRQAKEAYEDITGNEWISIDEAEAYLMDPDNYEAPEDRAGKSSFGSRSHGDGSETDGRTSSSGDQGEPSGDDDDGDECVMSGDDDGPDDSAEAPDGSGDVETPDGSDDAAETPGAADDVDHAQEGAAVQRR